MVTQQEVGAGRNLNHDHIDPQGVWNPPVEMPLPLFTDGETSLLSVETLIPGKGGVRMGT